MSFKEEVNELDLKYNDEKDFCENCEEEVNCDDWYYYPPKTLTIFCSEHCAGCMTRPSDMNELVKSNS